MSLEVKPLDEEIEITLIGTGGGYGESVIIHLGHQEWIVVDSCINPRTNQSLPLEYLQSQGVNYKEDVKLVLCTHWHDDHIRGVSDLFSKCENAQLSFALSNDIKKFLRLVSLDYQKVNLKTSISSTREFNSCLTIVESRKNTSVKQAHSDLLLFASSKNSFITQLFSLSPSDHTAQLFTQELSQLITEFGAKSQKIVVETPNAKSVALYLKFGDYRVILGSDLEVGDNEMSGWHNVINNVQCIDKNFKSSLFKIPHHGSLNGYHEKIWSDLIELNPISTITPWNKKDGLPTDQMLDLYLTHSDQVYLTSAPKNSSAKKRSHKQEKIIKDLGLKITEVPFNQGLIRSRINMSNSIEVPKWKIEVFGSAYKFNRSALSTIVSTQ